MQIWWMRWEILKVKKFNQGIRIITNKYSSDIPAYEIDEQEWWVYWNGWRDTRMKVIKAKRKQETLITSFTFSNEIEIYLKCFLFYVHVYI